jgi:hypothetical protein
MANDDFEQRKRLTFEQAEGAAPLPTQLKLKELSQELRAVLWRVVYDSFEKHTEYPSMGGDAYFRQPWKEILRALHVYRDHGMADDFKNDVKFHVEATRRIFEQGDYLDVFGWLQAVLRLNPPYQFADQIDRALRYGRASYRMRARYVAPGCFSTTVTASIK